LQSASEPLDEVQAKLKPLLSLDWSCQSQYYFRGFSLAARLVDSACNAVAIGKNSDAGLLTKRRNSWR
jgi:hypothetical protein